MTLSPARLYPLTFEPIPKVRVWGGRQLESLYGKALPPDQPVGESWEITDRPEGVSVIANGPLAGRTLRWLMENRADEVMGMAAPLNGRFPLLVKILDAQEVLSVQVHPPAAKAAELGGEPKTEMWYVTQAAPGAEILAGLKRGTGRDEFVRRLAEGSVGDCVHRLPVGRGDAMFLPSGRIHALGAGMVIFEIQQNSDTTYRVFDWNRLGTDGQPRELHVAQAMASIDFEDFEPGLVPSLFEENGPTASRSLVENRLFNVAEVRFNGGGRHPLRTGGRPLVLAGVGGRGSVEDPGSGLSVELAQGRFCLVPASVEELELVAEAGLTLLRAEPGS